MKDKIKNIIKVIVIFALFFNLSHLLNIMFPLIGIDIKKFDSTDIAYYETLLELLLAIISITMFKLVLKKDLIIFKLNKKDYINKILNIFILFLGIKIASSVATTLLSIILGYSIGESENQNIITSLAKSAPLILLIDTVILAPIVEEIIFRLSLKKIINNKYVFIIISGFIFGFMHIFPTDLNIALALIYSITYVTMGLFLAYTYEETNNIWINIAIHSLNNLISMLAVLALY